MQTRTTSKWLQSGVKNNVCKLILSPIAIEFIFLYFVFTVKLYRNTFHLFNVLFWVWFQFALHSNISHFSLVYGPFDRRPKENSEASNDCMKKPTYCTQKC